MKQYMIAVMSVATFCWAIAAFSNTAVAGQFGLDRNSSDIPLAQGSLSTSGGNLVTVAPWDASRGFQISMMGEIENPENAEWSINHYAPTGTTYDWEHYNYADYPYYHLQIDSTGNIPASFYTGGATGELLEWALYYTDSSTKVQTIFGGDLQNAVIEDGTFSAYLKVVPTCTYRTFDGTGEGTVNGVEIWNGTGILSDLAGYNITVSGSMNGDVWTSTGGMTLQPNLVPEPGAIVLLVTAGLGMLAYAWRRRRS